MNGEDSTLSKPKINPVALPPLHAPNIPKIADAQNQFSFCTHAHFAAHRKNHNQPGPGSRTTNRGEGGGGVADKTAEYYCKTCCK